MDRAEKALVAAIALMLFGILVLVWFGHQGPCPAGKHVGAVSYAPEMRKKYVLMVPTTGCVP
jgi:hypothetical protein